MKEKLESLQIGKVFEHVDVKQYTTFKVSAIADFLVIPDTIDCLKKLISFLKEEHVSYKVIGKGSNLVFVHDFHGVLIRLDSFSHLNVFEDKIVVGAGASLMDIAFQLSKQGFTGIEFATGVPGTIGGGIIQNAGCYGSDMAHIVSRVMVLDEKGNIQEFSKEQIGFVYRGSFFKGKPEYVILEAELHLEKGNPEEIKESIQDKRNKRFASQPLEFPSAGSVFRNPEVGAAGRIIEELGFKGKQIGGAKVSEKHANFIVNVGDATGEDIKNLVLEIQKSVKEEYGIDLICEQEFVK